MVEPGQHLSSSQRFEIGATQLRDGQRAPLVMPFRRGVTSSMSRCQELAGLRPCLIGRCRTEDSKRIAPGPALRRPVLHYERDAPLRAHAQPEASQLTIP